jgi:hypothetical protein
MSTSMRIILALGLVALAAACAPPVEEVVVVEEAAVTVEPTYTGKYGN